MDFTKESLDHEFPSRRSAVHFNHAAVSPLPRRTADALVGFASRTSERGGLDWRAWTAEVDEVRKLAARLIGAGDGVGGASSISIVPNTSWGLDLVADGLDWREGDEVVTTVSEFPSNLTPWLLLERLGVVVKRVPTRSGAFTTDDVARACGNRTRLVCVSAVAFHTGFVAPIAELSAFCRESRILFGLDAIQALGVVPVDLTETPADFLVADGHKWLLSVEGCGILFTTPELRGRLRGPGGWTNLARPFGALAPREKPSQRLDGRRFEPGTLPTPGVYALKASLGLLLEVGLPAIGARIRKTLAILVDGLPRLGYTPMLFEGTPRSGILAARPPAGKDARFVWKRLDEKSIVMTAREGFVRFSPHVGNDEEEAARVLSALGGL